MAGSRAGKFPVLRPRHNTAGRNFPREETMDSKGLSEDWLSVWIGLLVFVLALGMLAGTDVLGWVVTTGVWTDLSKALNPVSKAYSALGGVGALIATYVALLVVMTAGPPALQADPQRSPPVLPPRVWSAL